MALATAATALIAAPTPSSEAAPGSRCPMPPTDLCTDFVWRGRAWGNPAIPFSINLANAPLGAEQDILDAFLTWENETGSAGVESAYPGDRSAVSFVYQGPTAATGGRDGINTVHFSQCSVCGAAAATISVSGGKTKRIVEFDIAVNPAWGWQTDVTCPAHNCGAFDLQNAVTHEIGHALDLYHPAADAAAELTMYGVTRANETNKRDLGAGEVLALRRIYPA